MRISLWLFNLDTQEKTEHLHYTYSSNLWNMIYPNRTEFIDIDELSGKESIEILVDALSKAVAMREELEKYDGKYEFVGGTYLSFIHYISQLIQHASTHETWVWRSMRQN